MKLETFIRANACVGDDTVRRSVHVINVFRGWLGTRPLTADAVQEYEAVLKSRHKPSSLTNMVTALNLYLKWKGTDLKIRRPPKEYNPHPWTVADREYRELVARIPEAMERLAVRLSHDTGWSPERRRGDPQGRR